MIDSFKRYFTIHLSRYHVSLVLHITVYIYVTNYDNIFI